MMTYLSKRILNLEPSPTFAVDALVKELQKKGSSVINLGIGEPDFETPSHIKTAAIKAIRDGFTHYTATSGIPELKEAIVSKFKNDNQIHYQPDQIIVGSGSKPLLYCAFQVLCNPVDEVIVPTPAWSSYVEQIKLAGAKPILLPLNPPFTLTADHLKKVITKRTKIILLNSPSNPTGAILEKKELEKIAQLVVQKKLWVVTDEMYEKIVFKGLHISIASLGKEIAERTITVNGFSKTYAMTGWRVGFAGGPSEVIGAMVNLQGQLTANASSVSQMAALAALNGSQKEAANFAEEFSKRRKLLIDLLSQIPSLMPLTIPSGGFYFFIDIRQVLNKKYPSSALWCQGLLAEKKVAVIPGEAFYAPGFFRLSFVAKRPILEEAVKRIGEFINES